MVTLATLGKCKVVWRVADSSKPYLRLSKVSDDSDDAPPPPAPEAAPVRVPRLRSVSKTGTGRGTGRGGKAPADKLKRSLKHTGKRSEFIRFIGDRTVSAERIRAQFNMSNPNVNGYLFNLWRDHGIGYEKEGGELRLLLPRNCTWQTVWGK
jgi:hypothetical protein